MPAVRCRRRAVVGVASRTRVSDWLLFAVFAALSLMAQRNVILVGLIAPIVIASYLPEWKRPLPAMAAFAVPLVLLAIAGEQIASGKPFNSQWRVAVSRRSREVSQGPQRAASRCSTSTNAGGYLMWDAWPLQKTFVDGRALNESVFRDYMKIAYNYRDAQTAAG